MKKLFVLIISSLFWVGGSSAGPDQYYIPDRDPGQDMYSEMRLTGVINSVAFSQAVAGYDRVSERKKEILVVIDYSKPSTEERLYVLDMKNRRLLYKTYVSHGRGSGDNYATKFSNIPGSHQSSLGFFLTENTYQGRNGYSLILNGLEKDINDKAKERAIVIHGAEYSNPSVIKSAGRLGRSHGCPALPTDVNKKIIDVIKEGALIYIYANDKDYIKKSPLISNSAALHK